MKKIICDYTGRSGRAKFLSEHFKNTLNTSQSILDVGCYKNSLKDILGSKVYGIDVTGKPDANIDLEKESLQRFNDKSFDTVVCTEVLEHIDNFHEVLDDLLRVAKKDVIISLPNCTSFGRRLNVFRGKTGKFYGLPHTKPSDRHKWFFSWQELDSFFTSFAKANNLTISEKFLSINISRSTPRGRLLRYLLRIYMPDSLSKSYWIRLSKTESQ